MSETTYPHKMTDAEFLAARKPNEPVGWDPPFRRDWLVTEVIDQGPSHFYRYTTSGINLNCKPSEYGHEFSWRVPDLDWRYCLASEDHKEAAA